ncbi:E3 ubiquitin-protein ligase RING1-like [Dermacentor silvarum]|uniref:E3 ubiquitin-protein ligase RING1-like n=1 Tax=Dermacentor silvarum TaxID=543639 RepID=UPI002101380D|nr:E3 ubiquitin-protein ligase RING1-like [Dermacentor silvarum]
MTSSNLSKNWQLSAYELQRLPHKLVTDDTEVIVGDESYVPDFTCPICLGLFRKTVATDCLHRFCEECITTSLRRCKKECPTCRRKLVSKRSLRRDYRMDAMIAALLPNYDEDGASSAERATASQGGQLREGVKRGVPKQACEQSIVKDSDVGQKHCVKKARCETISTAIGNDLAPTTANTGCVEVKANVPKVSALTSPTAQRRYLYVFQQPRQVGRVSQAFAAGADGVARKGSDYRLTSRLPEGSQEPNAGARRVDARVLGEGVRPLPPPPSVAFAGIARRSASNAVSAASPAQVDHDATDTSEEASRVTSAQRSELIQSENFHADTGETSEDARGKSATDAAAMPTAAANRESSSTAFAPRRIRDYVMTLKPHLDTFLVNAESPMLRLRMTAQITMEDVAAHLRRRLSPDSVNRNDQRLPMYRIYAANESGEVVVLPDTMTVQDAVKRMIKDGARLELYYAQQKP